MISISADDFGPIPLGSRYPVFPTRFAIDGGGPLRRFKVRYFHGRMKRGLVVEVQSRTHLAVEAVARHLATDIATEAGVIAQYVVVEESGLPESWNSVQPRRTD